MKLIYFGTSSFAVPALERLAARVSLVVTQPDKPTGRKMVMTPSPVKLCALSLGIPVLTPVKARSPEFVDLIESMEADALIVASYGQILSERLLSAARQGGINLHGSLLPKYRGAAPIQRAIAAGDTVTGTTLMQMDRGMDTGDEIAKITTEVHPDESYGDLHDRLAILSADLIEEWIERIVLGEYPRKPQDHDQSTHAPKILREDCELDFGGKVHEMYDRFRSVTPSPGAFIETSIGTLKIREARLIPFRLSDDQVLPGTVVATSPHLTVVFGSELSQAAMEWRVVQPAGKGPISDRDFVNGHRITVGTNLAPISNLIT